MHCPAPGHRRSLQGVWRQAQAVRWHFLQRVIHQCMCVLKMKGAHKGLARQEERVPEPGGERAGQGSTSDF